MRLVGILAAFLLLISFVFAGTVVVTSPNGGGNYNSNSLTLDFNVSGYLAGETALIYYDADASSPSTFINTLTLNGGSCDDADISDNTACHYTWDITAIPDGYYYSKVVIVSDSSFDYSATSYALDKNGPIVSNPNPGDLNWVNPQIRLISIYINDSVSGVDANTINFKFDGADYNILHSEIDYNATSGLLDFNASGLALTDGSAYDVNVDANDLAGNIAARYNYQVRVDANNPGASVVDATITDVWVPSDSISVACNDLGGSPCSTTKYYYFQESSILANCPSTRTLYTNTTLTNTITLATDVNKYLCLWVEDEAGNHDIDISGKRMMVDATLPILSANNLSGWKNTAQVVTLTCFDSGIYDTNVSGCSNIGWDGNALFSSSSAQNGISSNGTSLSTFTTDLNFNLEGVFFLDYNATDNAGNSVDSNFIMMMDFNAPTGLLLDIASFNGTGYDFTGFGYTNDVTPDLNIFAYDVTSGIAGMQFSCDNNNWSPQVAYATTYADFNIASDSNGCSPLDGNKTIYVKFIDNAGNSAVASDWIFLDRVLPTLSSNQSPTWVLSNDTVSISCSDNNAGCYTTMYNLDDNTLAGINYIGWTTYIAGLAFTADGNYALDYNAIDRAGNVSTTYTVFVLIDKIAPITSVLPIGWQNADFNVTFSCPDGNGSGCKKTYYLLDTNPGAGVSYIDGNFIDYNVLVPITISTDGNYEIQYYSTDNVDHNETTNTTYLLIDKTDPASFTSSNPTAADFNQVRSDWNASSDALSGMNSYNVFRANSNDLNNWTLIATLTSADLNYTDTNSGDGLTKDTNYAYCYKIQAIDVAGNDTNSAYTCTWLESVAPLMLSLSASVSTSSVTLNYSASDINGSGVKGYWVKKNSDSWIYTALTSYTFSSLANGDYNFFVMASDYADHNSTDMNTAATVAVSSGGGPSGGGSGGGGTGGSGTIVASDSNSSDTNAPSAIDTNSGDTYVTSTQGEINNDIVSEGDGTSYVGTGTAGDTLTTESTDTNTPVTGLFGAFDYAGIFGILAVLILAAILVAYFVLSGKDWTPPTAAPTELPKKKWEFVEKEE
ncbi:MAG: hypothetical protein AABW59_05495 [archaeon]